MGLLGPTGRSARWFDLYWIVVHPGAQDKIWHRPASEMDRRWAGRQLVLVETSAAGRDYEATQRFHLWHGIEVVFAKVTTTAPGDDLRGYRKDCRQQRGRDMSNWQEITGTGRSRASRPGERFGEEHFPQIERLQQAVDNFEFRFRHAWSTGSGSRAIRSGSSTS
ncbi:MAG: hypothetical protein R2882_01965 [Gemmatimonadales bacterium]